MISTDSSISSSSSLSVEEITTSFVWTFLSFFYKSRICELNSEFLMFNLWECDWMCLVTTILHPSITDSSTCRRCSIYFSSEAWGYTGLGKMYKVIDLLLGFFHSFLMLSHDLSCTLEVIDLFQIMLTFSDGRMKAGEAWHLSLLRIGPS